MRLWLGLSKVRDRLHVSFSRLSRLSELPRLLGFSYNPNLPVDPVTRIPLALIPAPGHFGTMGRDTFTGPGYRNVDISGQREFRWSEKLRIQARLEVFNIFNTANLGLPDRRMTDPLFGVSTKTQDVAGGSPGIGGGGPRVMQVAVKLVF